MADETQIMYSETAEALLLADLGFYDTAIPESLKNHLKSLLKLAHRKLQRADIFITPGDLYDDQLQAMYAAWLYRNAKKGLPKPPALSQEIRDRQVETALAPNEEVSA